MVLTFPSIVNVDHKAGIINIKNPNEPENASAKSFGFDAVFDWT